MGIQEEFHHGAVPVFGSAIAGRCWRAWDDGVLTGVTYGQPWAMGDNTAICPFSGLPIGQTREIPHDWRRPLGDHSFIGHHTGRLGRHSPGAMGCSCGYWCYADHTMSAEWGHCSTGLKVVGLIRAWGHMTRGSKGYRAEKARIAAFALPHWSQLESYAQHEPPREIWARVQERYPVPVYPTIAAALAAIHATRSTR